MPLYIKQLGVKMFVYTLLLVCACALAEGKRTVPPSYVEAKAAMEKALNALEKNVLSMASRVPLMDDPRRHYAEMISAVCYQADNLRDCMKQRNYDLDFANVLNKTAAMGIMEPQRVIDKVDSLIKRAMGMTGKIRSLIEAQCNNVHPKDCNEVIDEEVKADSFRYNDEARTLMLVYGAATEFLEMEPAFALAAKRHAALKYTVEGKAPMKKLVMAVYQMKLKLHPLLC